MTNLIEVKTADLVGEQLNWAVAVATGLNPSVVPAQYGVPARVFIQQEGMFPARYKPSADWAQGGPLIETYKVLLTPPTEMVHRNFGPLDKRNGWYESGNWGSTIFGKERKHRRTAFHHPDSPLIVAMRAIAQFELGDTAQAPKELQP